jgi:hypothetical protein
MLWKVCRARRGVDDNFRRECRLRDNNEREQEEERSINDGGVDGDQKLETGENILQGA